MMKRGIQGEDIFIETESKSAFLDLLKNNSVKMKVVPECPQENELMNRGGYFAEKSPKFFQLFKHQVSSTQRFIDPAADVYIRDIKYNDMVGESSGGVKYESPN